MEVQSSYDIVVGEMLSRGQFRNQATTVHKYIFIASVKRGLEDNS